MAGLSPAMTAERESANDDGASAAARGVSITRHPRESGDLRLDWSFGGRIGNRDSRFRGNDFVRGASSGMTREVSSGFHLTNLLRRGTTRRRVALGLRKLRNKQLANPWKKHDNLPL